MTTSMNMNLKQREKYIFDLEGSNLELSISLFGSESSAQ